jgi:hypothetical protein
LIPRTTEEVKSRTFFVSVAAWAHLNDDDSFGPTHGKWSASPKNTKRLLCPEKHQTTLQTAPTNPNHAQPEEEEEEDPT